jgi:hypothetical protein
MTENAWGIILILGLTAGVVTVIVVLITQIFALARIREARDAALDRPADDEQRRVAAELGELHTRLAALEQRLPETP